jgi:hypothetical protein
LLDYLPKNIDYVGFDTSIDYFAFARNRHMQRGTFFVNPFDEKAATALEPFDVVGASGFYILVGDTTRTARLADLCQQVGATHCLSGSAAKNYIEAQLFDEAKVAPQWFDYAGFPEYPQLWEDSSMASLSWACFSIAARSRHVT